MKVLKVAVFLLELFFIQWGTHAQLNNVCRTYSGYFIMPFSSDCFYTPDLYQDVLTLLLRHTGVGEKYEVTTEDGYILDLFRIPQSNPKGVILLQHPLTADANVWVMQDNDSTAFHFFNAGYDVWMPNNRGNFYGKKHVKLSPSEAKFWDFTFHEMGRYDHKAVIDFIRRKTDGSKIIYIGHSLSTTTGIVYASMLPEEAASSLKIIINMSPITFLSYYRGVENYVAPYASLIFKFLQFTGTYRANGYNSWYMRLMRPILIYNPVKYLYTILISLSSGWNPQEIDPLFYNYLFSTFPSEYSVKLTYHLAQLINSPNNSFKMFDYGSVKNQKMYGSRTPPEYPLRHIKTPIFLMYSKKDTVGTYEDALLLYEALPERARFGRMEIKGMNHLDYHLGRNRIEKVYNKILKLLQKIL